MTRPLGPVAAFNRHVLLPVYYRRHGDDRLRRLRELESNEWRSAIEIGKTQLEMTNRLIRHAYDTSLFYRQRLADAGIHDGPIEDLSELAVIPVTTKSDLQRSCNEMISSAFRKEDLIADASGGSTGVPTVFYKDVNRHSLRRADQIRHDQWSGWRLGEKWALVWGARTDLVTHRSFRERMVERYLHRCISLDAFELDDDRIAGFIQRMKRFNPQMILGYANALNRVAEFVLRENLQGAVQPRGIVSSAESLTTEARERVSQAFECPVLDRYGSREVGLIASDCGAGDGLHINADNLIVEVVCGDRYAKPGETGDVIVTDLLNFGMPLIRYDLGDRATASDAECRCGRGLPLIASVDGRQSDFLIATNGTEVHGEFFTHLFYGHPDVVQFQVVQESRQRVVLRIVPRSVDCNIDVSEISETTARVLGIGTEVSVELCESIAPTRTGKHRFTISKISRD